MRNSASIQPVRGSKQRYLRMSCALWVAATVWLALPVRIPVNPSGVVFDGSKILVTIQETTGPFYRVKSGHEALWVSTAELERLSPSNPIFEMLNTTEVELLGRNPADLANYLCLAEADWVLSGQVVGITARWSSAFSGVVPLFWVDDFRPTRYFPNFINRRGLPSAALHGVVFLGPVAFLLLFVGRSIYRRIASVTSGDTNRK